MKKFIFLLCVAGIISLNAADLPSIPWGKEAYWKYVQTNTAVILVNIKGIKDGVSGWTDLANERMPFTSDEGDVWKVAQAHMNGILDRVFQGQEDLRQYDQFIQILWCMVGNDAVCITSSYFKLDQDLKVPQGIYNPEPTYEKISFRTSVSGLRSANLMLRNGDEVEWIQSVNSGGKAGQDLGAKDGRLGIPYKYLVWEKGGTLYLFFNEVIYDEFGHGYYRKESIELPAPTPKLNLAIAPLLRQSDGSGFQTNSIAGMKLTISGTGGKPFTVQYSSDLGNWIDLQTFEDPADIEVCTDVEPAPNRFYRVKVHP